MCMLQYFYQHVETLILSLDWYKNVQIYKIRIYKIRATIWRQWFVFTLVHIHRHILFISHPIMRRTSISFVAASRRIELKWNIENRETFIYRHILLFYMHTFIHAHFRFSCLPTEHEQKKYRVYSLHTHTAVCWFCCWHCLCMRVVCKSKRNIIQLNYIWIYICYWNKLCSYKNAKNIRFVLASKQVEEERERNREKLAETI